MKTSMAKASIAFTVILCSLLPGAHAQQTQKPEIEIYTIDSKILGEKRKVRIQLPAGNDKYTAYPVLYLLDGEVQTTMVAGQVSYLSDAYKIIPAMIVVGIENTDRMRDLTPTHTDIGADGRKDTSAKSPFYNTGGGEKFLQFIRQELMPFVEGRFHTSPYKILSGHSLGALMSVYCLMMHPDYFNAYIAISPSFQWDNNDLLKLAAKHPFNNLQGRLLFFSDANEDAAFHRNQEVFDSLLQQKKTALRYSRLFYPAETHISEPVKAFYDGIRIIYPNWHLPYNSSAFKKTASSAMVKEHYAQLSKTYNYNVIPPHDEIIAIARFLRNDPARITDAIELLQMNTINYPTSVINLETLGDSFLKAGDENNALASYKKAAALDPNDPSITGKLSKLSR